MIITFATMDTSYELTARRGKKFKQRCRPLHGEILARSMNNVGFLQHEFTELRYRGKKRRLVRCIFIRFGNYSELQLEYHILLHYNYFISS